jgi:hypothetical protein
VPAGAPVILRTTLEQDTKKSAVVAACAVFVSTPPMKVKVNAETASASKARLKKFMMFFLS